MKSLSEIKPPQIFVLGISNCFRSLVDLKEKTYIHLLNFGKKVTDEKNSDKNANGGSSSADWSTCLTVKNLWTWSKTSHLSKWTICWQFSSLYTKTRRKLMISFWSLLKKMRKILEFDRLTKNSSKKLRKLQFFESIRLCLQFKINHIFRCPFSLLSVEI